MKYQKEDVTLFEDDKILEDLANKYYVILNKIKTKEFKKPKTDTNLIEAFKQYYSVEFDIEEMIEFRGFMDTEYAEWKLNKVEEETKNAEIINLKDLGLD